MGKRAKKRQSLWRLWPVWGLVAAILTLVWFLLPVPQNAPHLSWRAPVRAVLPSLSVMPVLDEATRLALDLKDQAIAFEEKIESLPQPSPLPPPAPLTPTPPEPSPRKYQEARIALIIDDMGLTPSLFQRILRLPAPIALSFLPYAPRAQEQALRAQAEGHAILLHLPMEPLGRADPGPNALKTDQSEALWRALTNKNLDAFHGFSGVNNHMGSRFTAHAAGMAVLADMLRERGVFFVDSFTNPHSVGVASMRKAGVPVIARDVFLDDTPTPEAIQDSLLRWERTARRQGYALAIGHPHAATVQALELWLPQAQARGLILTPVRALLEQGEE